MPHLTFMVPKGPISKYSYMEIKTSVFKFWGDIILSIPILLTILY